MNNKHVGMHKIFVLSECARCRWVGLSSVRCSLFTCRIDFS